MCGGGEGGRGAVFCLLPISAIKIHFIVFKENDFQSMNKIKIGLNSVNIILINEQYEVRVHIWFAPYS